MILKKDPNHFITYIHNPVSKLWLEYDDLKFASLIFSELEPKFNLADLHLAMYETYTTGRIITEAKVEKNIEMNVEEIFSISSSDSNDVEP